MPISFQHDILPLKNELYRLALRITLSREEAEDVVQETMIKVWNNRERWNDIDSIEAYCLTICRNLALDALRKKENLHESIDEKMMQSPNFATHNLQDRIIQQERVQIVRKLVDALPEKQRSCMQLRDFEGKSYKEIATILNISEEQVKVNIFRARQAIKQRFSIQNT
jgi:RNA polymerase sigma-70 factor (ECF subfamily)